MFDWIIMVLDGSVKCIHKVFLYVKLLFTIFFILWYFNFHYVEQIECNWELLSMRGCMASSISGQQRKNRQGQEVTNRVVQLTSVTAKFVTKCLATHFYVGSLLWRELGNWVSIYVQANFSWSCLSLHAKQTFEVHSCLSKSYVQSQSSVSWLHLYKPPN